MNDCTLWDVVIVGSGPAGLSAAIYATRAGLKPLVVTSGSAGGQIAATDVVDNYPGIENVGGLELGQRLWDHAEHLGAEFSFEQISGITFHDDSRIFELGYDNELDASFWARSVIYAAGATPRKAGFAGEDDFRARGVSYCATCDGMFYRGKDVFVVGGGNTACEEALYLAKLASSVTLVVRKDHLRAMRNLQDAVLSSSNIKVRYLSSIARVEGDSLIERVVLSTVETDDKRVEETLTFKPGSVGVFVSVGQEPQSTLVSMLADLDERGYVKTAEDMSTRTPGLFCAGDVRVTPLRQAITAASDGAIAATGAARYLGILGE